jgi:hypothetical protein
MRVGKGRLNLATSQAIQEADRELTNANERGLVPGVGALADQPERPGPRWPDDGWALLQV